MACEQWMAAVSAEVDGEQTGVDPRLLAAHLEACSGCREFAESARRLRRATTVVDAPRMPDLSRRIVRTNAVADRRSRWVVLRALLAVVAASIAVLALPPLLLGHDHSGAGHEARHVGAFSVAYAVALLLVVVRPARARSILPVAAVLAGALLVTAAIDVVDGKIPLVEESAHLPELVSVVLVWALARPFGAPEPSAAAPAGGPPLRLLDESADDEPPALESR